MTSEAEDLTGFPPSGVIAQSEDDSSHGPAQALGLSRLSCPVPNTHGWMIGVWGWNVAVRLTTTLGINHLAPVLFFPVVHEEISKSWKVMALPPLLLKAAGQNASALHAVTILQVIRPKH